MWYVRPLPIAAYKTSHEHHHEPSKRVTTSPLTPTQTEHANNNNPSAPTCLKGCQNDSTAVTQSTPTHL